MSLRFHAIWTFKKSPKFAGLKTVALISVLLAKFIKYQGFAEEKSNFS